MVGAVSREEQLHLGLVKFCFQRKRIHRAFIPKSSTLDSDGSQHQLMQVHQWPKGWRILESGNVNLSLLAWKINSVGDGELLESYKKCGHFPGLDGANKLNGI